jgi:hypothetical protein
MDITLTSSKRRARLGCLRKETNHSLMVFTSYFFGVLQIQAKAKQVLNHPKYSSFVAARPAHPGSDYFFPGGGLFKNGFDKRKRRTQF